MPSAVRVLLFASAREAVGRPMVERMVPAAGESLARFLDSLVSEFPRLGRVLASGRVVQNGEFVRGTAGRVRPGDEIAIHPPYSGG